MIVDTSALIAILYGEPEAPALLELLHDADTNRISAANYVELFLVAEGQYGAGMVLKAEALLKAADVVVEPVTLEQADLARQAFSRFGRGRHKAALNYGDCFSYALARALQEPLLFKGDDFSRTDVKIVDYRH